MNNREQFEKLKGWGIANQSTESRVMILVNKLIDALYIPKEGNRIDGLDSSRIEYFKINDSEPINWGDLKCNEVKAFKDGSYLVIIDEAMPGECTTFCEYIEKYMKSWGWNIIVETEW